MKIIKLKIALILLLFVQSLNNLSLADNTTAHTHEDNDIDIQLTYEYPCEISGTILMATSKEVCLKLKEKISSHDHD